ncbi:MAG: pyridoxamine 5'-phosphate oxidase family protein [Mogibacterium sp.]|nr:pyridoxamine 5'-phosphate oxidase family protein [Mogibacterium sp.]
MFRKMRRSVQALSHEEMIDLLKTETRGAMSVQGDNGYPYGFPINHYFDEDANRIYIHGADFGHRVDAVRKDPKVSYCVFGQDFQKEGDWAKYVKSVIVFGKAELIEDHDEIVRISRLLCDKFPCPQEYVEHEIEKDAQRTLIIAIDIEDMNGKLVHEA